MIRSSSEKAHDRDEIAMLGEEKVKVKLRMEKIILVFILLEL